MAGQAPPITTTHATDNKTAHPEGVLRDAYYKGDDDIFEREGKALASSKDASLETRAWYGTTRFNGVLVPQGLELLDRMRAEAPRDPWTQVILIYSTGDVEHSISIFERLLQKDKHEDLVVLSTFGIARQMRDETDAQRLRAFFDQHKDIYDASARTITAEAEAIQLSGFWGFDKKAFDDAQVLFDRALSLDPHNFRALRGKATNLLVKGKKKDVLETYESAGAWAKGIQAWHTGFYGALGNNDDLKKPERLKQVESDAREVIEREEPTLRFFGTAVNALQKNGNPKAASDLIELVLKKYPNSVAAETGRLMKATQKLGDDPSGEKVAPEIRAEVVKNVIAYLNTPDEKDISTIYAAYGALAQLFETDRPTAEQLLSASKKLGPRFGGDFAQRLARRGEKSAEVEQLAKQRISEFFELSRTRGTTWHYGAAQGDVGYYWGSLGEWYSILGAAQLKQGKMKEAEESLLAAEPMLDRPVSRRGPETYLSRNPDALTALGVLYTEKGDYKKAEDYLSRSMSCEFSDKDEHPAIAAYKDLYLRQHGGSKDGLGEYMAKAYETDRTRRKGIILKTRIQEPKGFEPFAGAAGKQEDGVFGGTKGQIRSHQFLGNVVRPLQRRDAGTPEVLRELQGQPECDCSHHRFGRCRRAGDEIS